MQIGRPSQGFVPNVEVVLDEFNSELSEVFSGCSETQRLELRAIFQSESFEQGLLHTPNPTEFLKNSLSSRVEGFSPLHKSYPILNALADAQTSTEPLSSLKMETFLPSVLESLRSC